MKNNKERSVARYRFRARVVCSAILLGLGGIWLSYYIHLGLEQRNWNTSFRSTIVRQAQSVAELIRFVHVEDVSELKVRANNVNVRLIQNENILAANSRYAGAIPNISIENMSSDAFVRVGTALEAYRENIDFSERFYINDDRYNVSPRFIYMVDDGSAVETMVSAQRERNSNIARVLADSFHSVAHDEQELWLGLYVRGGDDEIAYDRILKGGNVIAGSLMRSDVEHFAGAPVYDRDGLVVIATVVLEYDISAAITALRQSRFQNFWVHFGITVGYIILVLLTARLLFSSLRRLIYNAVRIQRGDLNSKAFLKSNDELALIGNSMDRITEKIDSISYDTKSIINIQDSLFPSVYLEFLDKESIGELEVGEYVDRYVTILSIQTHRSEKYRRQLSSSADTIELVNDVVQYVGNVLDSDAGFIERFTANELLLVFTHNTDIAMETAMNIQYGAVRWNEERERNNKRQVFFNIALHRGTVSFGIVGENRFIKPYAASESIETTRRLSRIAKQIGSPIMLTETFSRNLVKSLNYQFRYLGSVLFGMTKAIQVMEEIDVYPDQLKRIIAATKIDFEEGVKSFERNYFKKARAIFDALADRIPADKVIESFRMHIAKQHTANQ